MTKLDQPTKKERWMGSLAHTMGLMFGVFGSGLIHLISDSEYVKDNARESLDWQITIFVYTAIPIFLGLFTPTLGFLLILADLAFSTVATKRSAVDGKVWEYPLSAAIFSKDNSETKEKDNNKTRIDRITKMYESGVIDQDEMEKRIDKTLGKKTKPQREKNLELQKE